MKKIKLYIPDIFKIYLVIPFISINIELLTRSEEMRVFNYLCFGIKIYKWRLSFDLKITDRKRNNG